MQTWVAREPELAEVLDRLPHGCSVVVTGEAGVGKSALVATALARSGLPAVTCRCFRSLARASAAPLQLGFATPVPVGDDLWTAQWIRRQLGRRVLVVEDLQWADALTLAVVGHLVDLVPVAATVRPGDRGSEAALAAVASAHLVDLEPLTAADAARLARQLHPHLRPEEALALAERCGGNPLLVEELGAGGSGTSSLRSSTLAQLRHCGDDAWRGFARLVRAGEPLPGAWVPGIDSLVAARLVTRDADLVRPRHALLAQVVADHLLETGGAADVDRDLAEVAQRERHPALAARTHAAAGDGDAAHACATEAAAAAERPGERAEMLHLAAVHASPDEAPALARAAVAELVRAGEYAAAGDLLARLPGSEDAAWWCLVGQVRWQLGDDDGTLDAYEAALAAPEDGGPVDVVVRSEFARALAITQTDQDRAGTLAREAVALAEERGLERARAWGARGAVGYFVDEPDHLEHLRTGVRLAEESPTSGDLAARFTLANNLVVALESAGEGEEAVEVATRSAAAAEDLRMRGWAQQLTAVGINAAMHRGDYGRVLVDGLRVLGDVTQRRTADQLEVSVGIALIDLGRLEEARTRIERAREVCADDIYGRGNLLWLAAEERIWSGQHTQAAALADESVGVLAGPVRLFGVVTSAHARARAGLPVLDHEADDIDLPVVAAVPHEVAGLRGLAAGDPGARRHFQEAAALWAGRHRRGELRCRWLAADAAAHEGPDAEAAKEELLELERLLGEQGWLPLLGAVRRSLRERGVRRAAPRGRAGDLTLREKEVLEMVGQGLSTDAIAVRLGLSPATVAAQVASARARLGASTRWQAAGAE